MTPTTTAYETQQVDRAVRDHRDEDPRALAGSYGADACRLAKDPYLAYLAPIYARIAGRFARLVQER